MSIEDAISIIHNAILAGNIVVEAHPPDSRLSSRVRKYQETTFRRIIQTFLSNAMNIISIQVEGIQVPLSIRLITMVDHHPSLQNFIIDDAIQLLSLPSDICTVMSLRRIHCQRLQISSRQHDDLDVLAEYFRDTRNGVAFETFEIHSSVISQIGITTFDDLQGLYISYDVIAHPPLSLAAESFISRHRTLKFVTIAPTRPELCSMRFLSSLPSFSALYTDV